RRGHLRGVWEAAEALQNGASVLLQGLPRQELLAGQDREGRAMTARITRTSREERETTVTFTRALGVAACSSAGPAIARRWQRAGWPVYVLGRYSRWATSHLAC